ncbi:hypothetical protein ABD76_08000 [Paenibacillus dendritiformis]|nr:hypothetical protein [Paenibacillus dendritiformis]
MRRSASVSFRLPAACAAASALSKPIRSLSSILTTLHGRGRRNLARLVAKVRFSAASLIPVNYSDPLLPRQLELLGEGEHRRARPPMQEQQDRIVRALGKTHSFQTGNAFLLLQRNFTCQFDAELDSNPFPGGCRETLMLLRRSLCCV